MNGCAGRSHSVPGNPFYSDRVQDQMRLEAARPRALPQTPLTGDGMESQPIQNGSNQVVNNGLLASLDGSGKGRGVQSAGAMPEPTQPLPTEGQRSLQTEGRMPDAEVSRKPESPGDGLQRAVEGELVDFLRQQNAQLMEELSALRTKVDRNQGPGVVPSSEGAVSGNGSWEFASEPTARQGRPGSRTPRSRIRAQVPSPARRVITEDLRFTPNGTRVPDAPPPEDSKEEFRPAPPLPPFPNVMDDSKLDMYDTCESKPPAKTGDVAWKPRSERDDVLSPAEAKQLWLAREGRAVQSVWDNVPVSPSFRQSAYWASGFEGRDNRYHGLPSDQAFAMHQLPGSRMEGDRALQRVLGDQYGQARAPAVHGDVHGQARAPMLHGVPHDQARIPAVLGDLRCHDRASSGLHGLQQDQARAPTAVHGDHLCQDRADAVHGAAHDRGRALHAAHYGGSQELHHNGSGHSCHLPRHDGVGGDYGGGRPSPWSDGGVNNLNTKAELPDLLSTATPLQFGDWVHLSTPVLKDISSVSARWWELTWREAKAYYQDWQRSTPLARIQIFPKLPDELGMPQYQRTEQRGVQMLLKAIPAAEQQSLVTDRILSSTAILYKLLVRFQPGGAGEKQILLQQLTSMPKTTTVVEIAEALRNWRRHFGRALEVEAVLPDGVLLLKALDGPIQQLGALDPQAAFRLAQSRMQLRLDEHPSQDTLWSFSQCLLAEAETLCLLQGTPDGPSTPLKLKQLDGSTPSPAKTTTPDPKQKASSTADKPCRYFISDSGCKAGKSCKWLHSWDGVSDKASRCWICGGKDHRKQECTAKSSKPNKGEPNGSGGGRGGSSNANAKTNAGSNQTSSTATVGGKAGAAAANASKASPTPGINEMSAPTGDGKGSGGSPPQPPVTTSTETNEKGSSSEKSGAGDLLNEAAQLLKSLRLGPKLKVMKLDKVAGPVLDQEEQAWILLDSGATHALRPAVDAEEWSNALSTVVTLAEGSTEKFRLKANTKVLLVSPRDDPAWILPMGGLAELGYTLKWSDSQVQLLDDQGRNLEVMIKNGCPMVPRKLGEKLMSDMEETQLQQHRKLVIIKTLLADKDLVDPQSLDIETAMTAKIKKVFPGLPDEVLMRIIPDLELFRSSKLGQYLPWNRRKRRSVERAQNIILHVFSGPDHKYWERKLSNATTAVLCVDLDGDVRANMLDRHVFGYLLNLACTGRVKCILGGPPCRTISALRYQQDNGPRVVRTEEFPYGVPNMSMAEAETVMDDVTLWFRFLALYIMAEEVRQDDEPQTDLVLEQPEDPARYRSQMDVEKYGFMSVFRTQEWADFQWRYKINLLHCDQGAMGHPKRKPTTLAVVNKELLNLDKLRGAPADERQQAELYQSMSMEERCRTSKTWSAWAPGLKEALVVAIKNRLEQNCPTSPRSQPGRQHGRPDLRALSATALAQWKSHFLHDHLPARRDCVHCVRAQARSKAHKKVSHPDAYTLSVDLSGKMVAGWDQGHERTRYIMVACYTFPVDASGAPLIDPPDDVGGRSHEPADVPLPTPEELDLEEDENGDPDLTEEGDPFPVPEDAADLADPQDPLREQHHEPPELPAAQQESLGGALDAWSKLVQEAQQVGVKNLTFVETLSSRAVTHVLPALARIRARLCALGLPLLRVHCDRARELCSKEVRKWTLDRGIITTLTTGSSFKSNGRVENEVGSIKRAIRTLVSAKICTLEQWPLAARHIAERRLRLQLQRVGWPSAPLLRFGSRAFALRKSWQERYFPWRDCREEVVILGPDRFSSLTSTNYYVQSVATKKYFYTDDVVVTTPDQQAIEDAVFLPVRGEQPMLLDGHAPHRRIHGKQHVPALQSMMFIEGENGWGNGIDFEVPSYIQKHFDLEAVTGSGDESWTLGTDTDQTSANSKPSTPDSQVPLEEELYGGGDLEEASNNWAGDSYPVASQLNGPSALRFMHANVTDFVADEMSRLDAMSSNQVLWMPSISEAIQLKAQLELQLRQLQQHEHQDELERVDQEFLVTKTISNAEVWSNLEAWSESIKKEYDQLVHAKQAVRQVSKEYLQQISKEKNLPIEMLPGKMVHTRKAGTGAYRSRAVCCGNYASHTEDVADKYASGADGNQIRMMIRQAAMQSWSLFGTDIRVAFLNAPKRDVTKITAMEIPRVFQKLNLAQTHEVWIIEKALYGLVTSPKDWGLHRDQTLPSISWSRLRDGVEVKGNFVKTPDENVWRLEEVNLQTGEQFWAGLMSVYVDDLLIAADDCTGAAAMDALSKTWSISDVEKAGINSPIKYCGFEIEAHPGGDGYVISQKMYEQEMIQRWNIVDQVSFPQFKVSENDDTPDGPVDPESIKTAQSMAGALLWLTTRTRPDLAMGVSVVCRLATRNPLKSIEVATILMKYIKAMPGGLHYPCGIPDSEWGSRGQLKVARHGKLLEGFADISFGAGSKHRSLQGLAVFYAGCIVSWQSSQQAFVCHSTAEAELVSYCDALNAGRSLESMICSMLKEPVGSPSLQRIIYGDNAAAISIAHGTGQANWRTRHLRVRASYLREAVDGTAPEGLWRLLHLRGTELVADGLTKPLSGQAFYAFLIDLGMKRPARSHDDNGGSHAAVMAMLAGSLMLSGCESGEGGDEAESAALWVGGALLMAFGAIYVGQLTCNSVRCCLRRLHGSLKPPTDDGSRSSGSSDATGMSSNDAEVKPREQPHPRSSVSTSLNITIQSQHASGSLRDTGLEQAVSSGAVLGPEQASSSGAALGPEQAVSSGAALGPVQATFSGAVSGPEQAASSGLVLGPVQASSSGSMSGLVQASSSGTAIGLEQANTTGVTQGPVQASVPVSSSSQVVDAVARALLADEDFDPAGLAPKRDSSGVVRSEPSAAAERVSSSRASPKENDITNQWNRFQHEHRGKGLSSSTLAKMYKREKDKMPWALWPFWSWVLTRSHGWLVLQSCAASTNWEVYQRSRENTAMYQRSIGGSLMHEALYQALTPYLEASFVQEKWACCEDSK